jgi:hypothetical protein
VKFIGDGGLNMGTTAYLMGLDVGQLRFAKKEVERLLEEKQRAPMVDIWRVYDQGVCLGNFDICEYDKALDLLIEYTKNKRDRPSHEFEVEILKVRIYTSEVEHYLLFESSAAIFC